MCVKGVWLIDYPDHQFQSRADIPDGVVLSGKTNGAGYLAATIVIIITIMIM